MKRFGIGISAVLLGALLGAVGYIALSGGGGEKSGPTPPGSPGPLVPTPERAPPTAAPPDAEVPVEGLEARTFRGTVLHAKTLEPIGDAAVTLLGADPRGAPLARAATGTGGAYAAAVERPADVEVIEVRKPGFAPGRISLEYEPGRVHDFELESARPVRGRVRFGDGRRVSAGKVWVLEKRDEATRVESSDAYFPVAQDGTFVAAARGDEVAVVAVGDDFQPRLSGLIDLRGPEEPGAEIEVEPARTVTGIVQDAAGRPVSGARVFTDLSLSDADDDSMTDLELEPPYKDPFRALAITGGQGRFSLGGFGHEPPGLMIHADGFEDAEIEAVGDSPVVVTLEPAVEQPSRTLTVAAKGFPSAGTLPDRAYLVGKGYHELMDREGAGYTLTGFRTTAGKGWILVPGYERVRVEWPEGAEAHHLGEIALSPGRVLEISVAGEDGQGIAGAAVTVDPRSTSCWTSGGGLSDVRFETDGEGRLSLGGLWDSAHSFRVSRDGFVTRDLSVDHLASHSGVLEVVLAREACIRGRVLGPDGDPLLRARVVVPHGDHDHAGDLTDWTGAFLVRGVPAGRSLTGFLYFAGAAPTPFEIRPLDPGKPWDAGDLRMLPGEALAGTVIDDEGRPLGRETLFIELVSEVEVESRPPIILWWGELPYLETDDAGRFELRGLLPGKYRLMIVHDDHSTQEKLVTVPTAAPVLFGPDDPDFQAHAGLVRDAGGAPVAGALVTVASRESREDNFHEDVRTRADGTFKIRNIPNDLLFPYLRVEHGLRSRTFVASSVSDLPGELVLERGCSLAIRVEMEEEDRDAGPPFLRLLRKDGRELGTVGPDESGAWIRAEDAPPGSYRGIVEARGHFPAEVEIEARLDRPFTAGVALHKFPPPRRYTLQVKSSKGVPMKGVEILSDLPGPDSRTDADGTAEILLIPGTEKGVRVRSDGYYPVRLDAAHIGERRVVEVILHPNGGVKARVTIPGAPADLEYRLELEPLEVPRWEDASRDGAWSVTGPDEYVITDLPAGHYALVVASYSPEMENWAVARQEVTVIDGETVDSHIELPAHFQIRGAVTGAGTPLAGKQVYLSRVEDGSEYLLRAKLDLAGRFSRSACVAGKYAISVAVDGELKWLGEVEITGDADLSLELER